MTTSPCGAVTAGRFSRRCPPSRSIASSRLRRTGGCGTTAPRRGTAGMRRATTSPTLYRARSARVPARRTSPRVARTTTSRTRAREPTATPAASAAPAALTPSSGWSPPPRSTSPTWWPCSARCGACCGRTGRCGSTSARRLRRRAASGRMAPTTGLPGGERLRSGASALVHPVEAGLAGPSVLLHMAPMAQDSEVRRVLVPLVPISVMDVELLCRAARLTRPDRFPPTLRLCRRQAVIASLRVPG